MWNAKQTIYEDGSSDIMISDYAFGMESDNIKHQKTVKCADEIVKESKRIRTEDDIERSSYESVRRSKQKVEIIGRANKWEYFITLTFDKKKVDSFDYVQASKYIEKWLDKMRHRYPNMKSLIVFEKHPSSGRWHAHGLLSECNLNLVDSGKKTKRHEKIYNMPDDYEYGFTTVTYVRSSAAAGRYISKYIGKALGDVPPNAKRYWASRNCVAEKDCTVKKYILDEMKNAIKEHLQTLAYRVSKSYISQIDNTVFYYHLSSYLEIDDLMAQFASAVT